MIETDKSDVANVLEFEVNEMMIETRRFVSNRLRPFEGMKDDLDPDEIDGFLWISTSLQFKADDLRIVEFRPITKGGYYSLVVSQISRNYHSNRVVYATFTARWRNQ